MNALLENEAENLLSQTDASAESIDALTRIFETGHRTYEELRSLGANIEYCWLPDIAQTLVTGANVIEIETVGPYVANHVDPAGVYRYDESNFSDDEKIGLELAKILRKIRTIAGNVRIVSLIDEVNIPDSKKITARDQADFVDSCVQSYRDYGIILPEDEESVDYYILKESSLAQRFDRLKTLLEKSDSGRLEYGEGSEIRFIPPEDWVKSLALHSASTRKEIRSKGILLKKKDGSLTCQAMDAAGFLHESNRNRIHLVMLGSHMSSQQHKTYALLKALGITKQERYHNIFFEPGLASNGIITYIIVKLLAQAVGDVAAALNRYSAWHNFDPDHYCEHNYGERILDEDEEIIQTVTALLRREELTPGSIKDVADIGSGPNLYPSMLIAPFVSNDSQIDMIEYAASNRDYMDVTLVEESPSRVWGKFEDSMIEHGGELYRSCESRAKRLGRVLPGDIYELPPNSYDFISSYFVAESISESNIQFREALLRLKDSLRQKGIMVIAHMVRSEGYSTGDEILFPALNLSIEELREAYLDMGSAVELISIGDHAKNKARDGYSGMALAVVRK